MSMLVLATAITKGGAGHTMAPSTKSTQSTSSIPSNTIADLSPELRDALVRDAACKNSTPADGDLLQSPVTTQEIHSAARGDLGVIAAFSDGCHCEGVNCGTYVYLKSSGSYKLAFAGSFASLHPMKVSRNGYPSLTGRLQVSDSRAETTVFDWNGKNYRPSLCATVTQGGNRKRPSIVRHPCSGESRPQ